NHVYPGFLETPHSEAAPDLVGTRIEKIGQQPVRNLPELLRATIDLEKVSARTVSDLLALKPEDNLVLVNGERLVRIEYRGAEDNLPHAVWCKVGTPPRESLAPAVIWLCIKMGLFAVGFLVFWKRPTDRSAALFFLLCTVTFGAYIGGYHWWQILTRPTLLLVFMVCSVLLPAVSLHFYLVFPRPKTFLVRRPLLTLALIYGPPACFLTLLLAGYLFVRFLFQGGGASVVTAPQLQEVLEFIKDVVFVYFGVATLWYVASVLCLADSYRGARDDTERNQVKCILVGALAAAFPLGYSLYLAFFDAQNFGAGGATLPMFAASACFTVAFTVSITRYRLLKLNELISSGMVYFLISSAAGLVYYALVGLVMVVVGSRIVTGPSFTQALWVSGTTLVLVVLLDLARGRVRAALDRHFHRQKHQLDRTLQQMSEAIQQLVDPEALARRLLGSCSELLGVTGGAIYLRAGDPPLFRLTDHVGAAPPLTELSPGCPLVEALRTKPALFVRPGDGTNWWTGRGANGGPSAAAAVPQASFASAFVLQDPARRQLHFLGGEAAQALVHEGQLLALLVLGPRTRGAYTVEDLNLLAAISQITALALVGAEGRRTIEILNRDLHAKVEKIGEQQRRILALQSQLTKQRSAVRSPEPGTQNQEHESRIDEASSATHAEPNSNGRGIVGSSAPVQELLQLVKKVSTSELAVLFRGESGTGKELLARALHESSPRADKPYVKVHCAALSPSLLESELFGHVKGAFTGAHRDKVGRFELADGGTLFLDEIGDISLEVQTKLLRVLQEKTFERVGSSDPTRVDVRLVAATHQDLEALIEQGRFREDLFYRLNGFPITVPPLRERREDIPELAIHFLAQCSKRSGKVVTNIDDDAMTRLKGYHWPGNIRQLENVVERAVVIVEGTTITEAELPLEVQEAATGPPGTEESDSVHASVGIQGERAERARVERERLVRALAAASGNKAEAARVLGLKRSTLISRLKKHGLS
ncbi:MAG TPA: sigma 54-interacting transcriptional regulator, partial [Gemmataceae bacterium]|nr:sigma 54-interacting transcriptional regulator [Gemmataceae bacterium]